MSEEQPTVTETEADTEQSPEEEQQFEPEPPKVYTCPCHYCDDEMDISACVGKHAPNFYAESVTPLGFIQGCELSDFRGKWLVIFTFPYIRTTITPSEVVAFSENYNRFTDINCEVLGLSGENQYVITAWTQKARTEGGIGLINYTIACDMGHDIARRYGIYDDTVPVKATLIIDPEGVIKHMEMHADGVTRSVEETLRLVKAFQFAAEHGEVCPAQWKEGEPAIKPAEAKSYFEHRY